MTKLLAIRRRVRMAILRWRCVTRSSSRLKGFLNLLSWIENLAVLGVEMVLVAIG